MRECVSASIFLGTFLSCSAVAFSEGCTIFSVEAPEEVGWFPYLSWNPEDEGNGFVKEGKIRLELELQSEREWESSNNLRSTLVTVIDTFPVPACCVPMISDLLQRAEESRPRWTSFPMDRVLKLGRSRCLTSFVRFPFWLVLFRRQLITACCLQRCVSW
jgi:hypothetical protein